jgi:hypothetical protein
MAAIGDSSLSVISGSQKNAISLASLNFDFAMVKIAPPTEYQELGTCLSTKRRREAEDGALHSVARKLSALFADELPEIPNLIHAYGTRASEISANRTVNPKGSRVDGAFAAHIGADGTSIWAAATSGKGAIAVHLLACMLARIWSAREATSIFSEIVAAKKAILKRKIAEEGECTLAAVTAAEATISREQLSDWDSSARYAVEPASYT